MYLYQHQRQTTTAPGASFFPSVQYLAGYVSKRTPEVKGG